MSDGWYFKNLNKFCLPKINESNAKAADYSRAEFPGGQKERLKFIEKNMEYPNAAYDKGIEGAVYVSFYVEEDGSLSNIEIIKGLEGGFNEEVVRLIKLMPKWKPAIRDGKPIRMKISYPMAFRLNDL